MRISEIVRNKAKQNIECIDANSTIAEAAAKLSILKIGSLLVSSDGGKSMEGIISERDIVRELGVKGSACLALKVAELMTTKVQVVNPETTAEEALEKMTSGRFRHMPVMENDSIIGMISIGDVVAARLKQIEHENAAMSQMIAGTAF